jgi:urocanate hydratase
MLRSLNMWPMSTPIGVCTSGDAADLRTTDKIAGEVLKRLRTEAPPRVAAQLDDNTLWIERAEENKLVVGSQARILYADFMV